MSRPGQGRKPSTIGIIGIVLLLMLAVSSFYARSLPYIGGGVTYTANFSESAGLTPGNEVRVAGIRVGEVTAVTLDGDKVKVKFRVQQTWIGDQSSASIQIKTVLGQKYLAIDPEGTDRQDPDKVITRTTAPYDVIEAFSDAARQIEGDPSQDLTGIDTKQLATGFTTLSQAFSGVDNSDVSTALDGLSRLSDTIASRDQQVQKLLAATAQTSKILADRNKEFETLIQSAGDLVGELNTRQQSIHKLLVSTSALSDTLSGIVQDNEATLGPALDSLKQVTTILQNQDGNLRKAITYYGPFLRLYSNVLGNGRWFDQVITNVLPPGLPDLSGKQRPNSRVDTTTNNGGTEATR